MYDYTTAITIVLIIVCIVCLLLLYRSRNAVKVLLFKRASCSACTGLIPEWDKAVAQLSWLKYNIVQIDTSDPANGELSDNFMVTTVPSIWKIYPDSSRYSYPSDTTRTADNIIAFIQAVPQSQSAGK